MDQKSVVIRYNLQCDQGIIQTETQIVVDVIYVSVVSEGELLEGTWANKSARDEAPQRFGQEAALMLQANVTEAASLPAAFDIHKEKHTSKCTNIHAHAWYKSLFVSGHSWWNYFQK